MNNCTETLQGYIVDIICIRKYPQNETVERARAHKRDCALAGHCAESGFGLIDEEGRVALLDPKATLQVLEKIRNSPRNRGIKLQVKREMETGGEMGTVEVEEIHQY
ncbi:MAG: hypothetical protein KI793_33715 [Rivularia sp. (in: Bacteria)]|nr:hypothetical protein [Rivularia sp. MS3]